MKTNKNHTQKTEPSAEDKALAELVRTKILDFCHGMMKLCKDNDLSFNISGWVEDPVDRGDTHDKTLKFKCGKGDVLPMVVHQIIDISSMLQDCGKKFSYKNSVKKFSYNEVTGLCTMTENLISYACKKVMTNLNNKMETKENVAND